jgi:hypothetical protein
MMFNLKDMMMKTMKKWFVLAFLPFFLFLYSSCSEEDTTDARLRIILVDSPGDYEAVNVDILGVSVHTNEMAGEDDGGWVFLENSNVGVINLLEYTGGKELTLADTDFPAGRISQIRLLLGENNTLVIDGSTEPMMTPSAQQSGLKLKVNETLKSGLTYEFKLDFEAARSVVHTGSGKFILKPVINVITETTRGAIQGIVMPAEENVAVYVIQGEDTVSSTYASAGDAGFLATRIPAGIYLVSLDPGEESAYAPALIEDVEVNLEAVTDVGTTELVLK